MLLPDITGWPAPDVEAILGEIDRWEPVIRRIADKHGLSVLGLEAGFPASSAVFLLDDVAIKVFQPSMMTDAAVESVILRDLASTSFPAPTLLYEGQFLDRQCWPYLIVRRIPGVALRELLSDLGVDELCAIGSELGVLVRELHSRGPVLAAQMKELGRSMSNTGRSVLANRDLTEDHLYLEREGDRWQITGLLDFADSVVGPKELDWHDLQVCMFQNLLEPMDSFLTSYRDATELR